jgi:hypothetical protein
MSELILEKASTLLQEPMMYDSITVEAPPSEDLGTGEAAAGEVGDFSYSETTDSEDGSE